MAFRLLYFLIAIFLVSNVILFAISNITGVNIYQKYKKQLKIAFWIFVLLVIVVFALGAFLAIFEN